MELLIKGADWQKLAKCGYDPDLFFVVDDNYPSAARDAQEAKAKDICRRCPVSGNCLDAALQRNERFGIWGGMTEEQRRAVKRIGPRASCPRCVGRITTQDERSQICLLCGLTWLL